MSKTIRENTITLYSSKINSCETYSFKFIKRIYQNTIILYSPKNSSTYSCFRFIKKIHEHEGIPYSSKKLIKVQSRGVL